MVGSPRKRRSASNAERRLLSLFGQNNTGTAWWLGREGPGPYDDPEMRPLGERCLLAFGSSSGPPMLPTLYNNLKRIVQTPDYVMILNEMVHDARIIRLEDRHTPGIRQWMGDSVGHWEGDTLVVETENFKTKSGLYFFGATEGLRVVERFTRTSKDQLLYAFTVEDAAAWEASWSGEYPLASHGHAGVRIRLPRRKTTPSATSCAGRGCSNPMRRRAAGSPRTNQRSRQRSEWGPGRPQPQIQRGASGNCHTGRKPRPGPWVDSTRRSRRSPTPRLTPRRMISSLPRSISGA